MKIKGQRTWLVRAAGWALIAVFLVFVARFWHPVFRLTSLLQLDSSNDELKIQAFKDLPVYVYRTTGGYDGFYYAQIAYHPSLADPELVPATDSLAYRARRILPSALAWIFAAGQPALIVHVYSFLNIAAWLALAWLLWRILEVQDFRSWLGWAAVLFSAGALGSVRLALTDLIALVILAAGLMFAERNRPPASLGLIALAGLARETSVLAFVGAIDPPFISRRNFFRALLVVAPLAFWLGYIRWQVGTLNAGWGNFAAPALGLIGKWKNSWDAITHGNPDHASLAWTTLLATIGLSVQLFFFVTRRRLNDPWWRVGTLYGIMMLFLGTAVWEGFPGAATRVLLPLTLAFNVLAVRTRTTLLWLILGNLAVPAGVQMFLHPPTDPTELAAARSHGTAIIAETGSGWYGVERTARHAWSWNSGDGVLRLKTWPSVSRHGEFRGTLRSVAPCMVAVTQDGVVLWRGESKVTKTEFSFPFTIAEGRGELKFATDTPGVPEGSSPDARRLAFAVYDVRLMVSEK
ncbi:MAG: hypothetical protein ABIZ81_13015 [Opitutaceae bacterium]